MTTNEKKLGFGLMRLPRLDADDEASTDLEQMKQMVDTSLERGFIYFDTVWMYCGFNSEIAVREALVKRYPRDSSTLATKLNVGFTKSRENRDKIFNEQLAKTGVEYFDYYLLHTVSKDFYKTYTELDCFRQLVDKKKEGLVKRIDFSYHDSAKLLDRMLTEHPEVELVQLQINYFDWDSGEVQSGKCYEVTVKHGKKVIIMEPVRGGTLTNVSGKVERALRVYAPECSASSWAVRFAASLDHVMVILSGMSNLGQVLDNMGYVTNFQPLSEEEKSIIRQAVDIAYANIAVACIGCAYCTDGCPQKIATPKYFSPYNRDRKSQRGAYEQLMENFGKAGDCIACGQCEEVCPQHLPIIRHLKEVAGRFENQRKIVGGVL